jgi:hypothetical protein
MPLVSQYFHDAYPYIALVLIVLAGLLEPRYLFVSFCLAIFLSPSETMRLEPGLEDIGPYLPSWTDAYLLGACVMTALQARRRRKLQSGVPVAFVFYL